MKTNFKSMINKSIVDKFVINVINVIKCDKCNGTGWGINIFKIQKIHQDDICKKCDGRGYL